MKPKKERSNKPVFPKSSAKARLRNLGNGTLELTGDTIRFYTEKGRLRKRKVIAKEIPIAEIENIERVGNEFSITWKGIAYAFVSEKAELVDAIYEKAMEALKEQRKKVDEEEVVSQIQSELTKILNVALDIIDSLFNILRSLHGRIEWDRVENYLRRSKERNRRFTSRKIETINLDFTKLSLAIKEHHSKETSRETYSILKSLYEYFSGLPSKNGVPEKIHPKNNDSKSIIRTYYTLNDIFLGTTVGDEEIGKEINELVMMLDDLSKKVNLKINVDAIKDNLNKVFLEKEKEAFIEESRAVFIEQLKELINPVSA
jgi:hypothetical protein